MHSMHRGGTILGVCLSLVALTACGSDTAAPTQSTLPTSPATPAATTPTSAAPTPAASGGTPSTATPIMQPSAASPATSAAPPPAASSGTAGAPAAPASAPPPVTAPATPPPTATPAGPTPGANEAGIALDECGLHTTWNGDQYCIKPPAADKGFQIHIGPASYDNPEAKYQMQPGEEYVEDYSTTSGNKSDVFYYWRQYRMRPGTHHMIMTSGGIDGHRLGGSQNLAWDNPARGEIPPENAGVGMKLAANTPININLHYLNYTDKPILKEVWVNFWYRDAADVKETANELYSFAPMNVAPGQHVVIHGDCGVMQSGRILTLYGHRHANNTRFSVWREHGSEKTLVYEDYDWEDPLLLEYNSLDMNAPADPAAKVRGGWSGILDVTSGDKMSFECEIVNMSNKTFRGANEAKDDEMCIMIGDTVGTSVSGLCQYTTKQVTD